MTLPSMVARVGLNLPEPLAALDAWLSKQRDEISRLEAIRRLVELGLKRKGER